MASDGRQARKASLLDRAAMLGSSPTREPNKLRKRRPDRPPSTPPPSPSPVPSMSGNESGVVQKGWRRISTLLRKSFGADTSQSVEPTEQPEFENSPEEAPAMSNPETDEKGEWRAFDEDPKVSAPESFQAASGRGYLPSAIAAVPAAAAPPSSDLQSPKSRSSPFDPLKDLSIRNPDPSSPRPRPSPSRQTSDRSFRDWLRDPSSVSHSDFVPSLDAGPDGEGEIYDAAMLPAPLFARWLGRRRHSADLCTESGSGIARSGARRRHHSSSGGAYAVHESPYAAIASNLDLPLSQQQAGGRESGAGVEQQDLPPPVPEPQKPWSTYSNQIWRPGQDVARESDDRPWPLPKPPRITERSASAPLPCTPRSSSTIPTRPSRLSASRTASIAAGEEWAQEPEKYVAYRPPAPEPESRRADAPRGYDLTSGELPRPFDEAEPGAHACKVVDVKASPAPVELEGSPATVGREAPEHQSSALEQPSDEMREPDIWDFTPRRHAEKHMALIDPAVLYREYEGAARSPGEDPRRWGGDRPMAPKAANAVEPEGMAHPSGRHAGMKIHRRAGSGNEVGTADADANQADEVDDASGPLNPHSNSRHQDQDTDPRGKVEAPRLGVANADRSSIKELAYATGWDRLARAKAESGVTDPHSSAPAQLHTQDLDTETSLPAHDHDNDEVFCESPRPSSSVYSRSPSDDKAFTPAPDRTGLIDPADEYTAEIQDLLTARDEARRALDLEDNEAGRRADAEIIASGPGGREQDGEWEPRPASLWERRTLTLMPEGNPVELVMGFLQGDAVGREGLRGWEQYP
ncbi:hypothetical protein LTR53_009158 [Teratosphaeriaceae sp. CCFEE 6253]|nr:hypothetical protein LTR53_009158 [Teratosphaeriaceae sp. CCFEE 6253]